MNPLNKISVDEEAELRVMTSDMYKCGGVGNVLECIHTMQRVQVIIVTKLNEILEEEYGHRKP